MALVYKNAHARTMPKPWYSCPDTQHATRSALIRRSTRRLPAWVWRDTFAKTRANTLSQHAK
eukprot:3268005-Pyramimonas_sp.AAC.1